MEESGRKSENKCLEILPLCVLDTVSISFWLEHKVHEEMRGEIGKVKGRIWKGLVSWKGFKTTRAATDCSSV